MKSKLTKEQAADRIKTHAWCRGVGHWWQKDGLARDGFTYIVKLICRHCGCRRATRVDVQGAWTSKQHNTYKYPGDYQTPGYKADRGMARAAAFFDKPARVKTRKAS